MGESASISNRMIYLKRRARGGDRHPGRASWRRTEAEQLIYSSKLIDVLRSLRRSDSVAISGRTVRSAADKVLAVSAKGETRWSRTILRGRVSCRLARNNRRHKKGAKPVARSRKPAVRRQPTPLLQRKVKVLRRLVPGCRKIPIPNLLEETGDYITALQMQVNAMAFVMGILSGHVESSSSRLSSA